MEDNINQNCHELHHSGSDIEKNSNDSSKDEGSNYDSLFFGTIKAEYEHCSFEIIDGRKSQLGEQKSTSSMSHKNIDASMCKKRQLFKCCLCPKVFSNSSAIAKHKLTHSDERKYVCETCGKAFKRQDHLNGHKHTHKANKPHACHLCDRSYSDARSLRRHYENQHQNEFMRCKEQRGSRDSGGSSVDESNSVEVFGFLDETKSIKCEVCSKGFKNQSALNGHMRLHGGYGQTKNCITGPGELRPLAPIATSTPDKGDPGPLAMAHSPGLPSSRLSNIMIISNMPNEVTHSRLHSLLTMKSPTSSNAQMSVKCDSMARGFGHCLPAISSSALDTNNLSNMTMDELYICMSPPSGNNRNLSPCPLVKASNSPPLINKTAHSIVTSSSIIREHGAQHSHYSPITPAFSNHVTASGLNDSRMFNYPANLDSQDLPFDNSNQEVYQYSWDNTHTPYISTNTNIINKQWSYFDSPSNISDLPDNKSSNPSSLPQISSSNNLQDLIMNLESIDPCNHLDVEWCKFSDGNDDTNNIAESSETESFIKKELMDVAANQDSNSCDQSRCNGDPSDHTFTQETIQEMPMSVLHKKNKNRPAPIFIPPQTSAYMSRLRSPRVWNTTDRKEVKIPPYTPPPMLSPQRKGSGLFNSVWNINNRTSGSLASSVYPWTNSLSSSTITAMSNSYCNNLVVPSSSLGNHQISSVIIYSPHEEKMGSVWLDQVKNPLAILTKNGQPEHFLYQDEYLECQPLSVEDSDGLPTSATPRINIGPCYQAQLPSYRPGMLVHEILDNMSQSIITDKDRLREDKRDWDTLLWDPKQFKETVENTSSLDLLMKIASSPAVKSCGLNMEYTFHLLCKFKGDLEKTLQALLEDSFVVYDYVYAETTNWTTEEINKFQERLKKHDRDFMRVALDLQSCGMNKSVKACVEFYYVWKQMNNAKDINRFRNKLSRKKCNNNSSLSENSICAPHNSTQGDPSSGYNLRRKFPSGNQKLFVPYATCGGYRTASDSSSRESSPMYYKSYRNASNTNQEKVKKSQSYHCSHCKRKFAKSKALENHLRTHSVPNVMPDKLLPR